MNGKIDPNLTEAKQSSLQEEITEPNNSGTNDTTLIESENDLMQEDGAILIADGTIKPPPPPPEIMSSPPEIMSEVIV
ncbi:MULTISPECIES: hypothetical protein [Nostoc]|uniref:Uncharacterized protein n=2 Tax=Nostoc TaxID=1177 RepID=A0ABR8IJT3_9NOSO|nr:MULTISPECIES: hypothetical protein [Nostoc]MBD2565604.1 hypothetical protein [Nostoc linckia FACHB-391]MBD2651071.1 hypothetical protein [Nostoc foliaceum FACHB-393]